MEYNVITFTENTNTKTTQNSILNISSEFLHISVRVLEISKGANPKVSCLIDHATLGVVMFLILVDM